MGVLTNYAEVQPVAAVLAGTHRCTFHSVSRCRAASLLKCNNYCLVAGHVWTNGNNYKNDPVTKKSPHPAVRFVLLPYGNCNYFLITASLLSPSVVDNMLQFPIPSWLIEHLKVGRVWFVVWSCRWNQVSRLFCVFVLFLFFEQFYAIIVAASIVMLFFLNTLLYVWYVYLFIKKNNNTRVFKYPVLPLFILWKFRERKSKPPASQSSSTLSHPLWIIHRGKLHRSGFSMQLSQTALQDFVSCSHSVA